jgi:hypothetical protein
MQSILVNRLRFRSYDNLFLTNTANSIPLFSGWRSGNAHIDAKSYSDKAVPKKHCCDNSKHVSMEIPVLDKYSVAW